MFRRQRRTTERVQRWLLVLTALLGSMGVIYWAWRRFFVHLPSGDTDHRDVQRLEDGVGPIVFRRYWVEITGSDLSNTQLMERIQSNLNDFVAEELAYFEPEEQHESPTERIAAVVAKGKDFFIDIAGPWNGPVRVAQVSPTAFTLVTLDGHLEAGEICFRLVDDPHKSDTIIFEIFSFARSRDVNVHIAYNVLHGAKVAQTSMWVIFCNKVLECSGGETRQGVQTLTQKVVYPTATQPEDGWRTYEADLKSFREASLNFNMGDKSYADDASWQYDEYRAVLPPETMAPPGFSVWEAAKDIVERYEFPSPSIVRGYYRPESPLEERIIVIEAYFWFFKFVFGLRVHDVIDEERTDDEQGRAQVVGFSYRTLQGHFEMGEMWFEVWHFVEVDRVEFRIRAYSQRATIDNLFYRWGFSMFGRYMQQRYAQLALRRMQALVAVRMDDARHRIQDETLAPDEPIRDS